MANLTDTSFDDTVMRVERATWVVLFYAPWCPVCRKFDAEFKAISVLFLNEFYTV